MILHILKKKESDPRFILFPHSFYTQTKFLALKGFGIRKRRSRKKMVMIRVAGNGTVSAGYIKSHERLLDQSAHFPFSIAKKRRILREQS